MHVAQKTLKSGLFVLDVDKDLQNKTPVAQLNAEEKRQAERDENETHASFAIRPGDRIREICAEAPDQTLKNLAQSHTEQGFVSGGTMSATAMLTELTTATSETSPRVVNLSVSHNISDLLKPAETSIVSLDSSVPFPPGSTQSNLTSKRASNKSKPRPTTAPPQGSFSNASSPAPNMDHRRSLLSTGCSPVRSASFASLIRTPVGTFDTPGVPRQGK
jgi:hypothetical protein